MSADAVDDFISFDFAKSEEDKIKEQEEMIDELKKESTLDNFVEACKNIGKTAVAIDNDFIAVKDDFDELVKKYGKDFPKVGSDFVPRWAKLKGRWEGKDGLLWSSRELAAKTSAKLTDYSINLRLVEEIASEKDLREAKAELKQYVDDNPINIGTSVADGFKDLRNDIEKFSKDFSKYLEEEKKRLTQEAEGYEADIKKYQAEVDSINEDIKKVLISLAATAVFGIALIINVGFLTAYLIKRGKAQKNLDDARANLEKVKAQQNALAEIAAEFEVLKPRIDQICSNLGIFAMIWAFMTEQSTEVNTSLDEGMHVLSTKKFKIKLELLRAQIEPLQEGMKTYAVQIVNPPAKSA